MDLSRAGTAELLMRGVAAAHAAVLEGKPQDYEEAEFYLEWVLRSDADHDQEMEAWYWLARIAKDPERKKECLQNVLAIRPTHPEARRELAILEGKLKVDEMRLDPSMQGAAVVPGTRLGDGDVIRFKCPKCGASTVFPPGRETLRCQFCGIEMNSRGEEVQTAGKLPTGEVSEQDWIAAIYTDEGHRWVLPLSRTMTCEGCRATVTFPPSRVSAKCPYCGTAYAAAVEGAGTEDLREPDGMVGFAFDAQAVLGHARKWLADRAVTGKAPADLPMLAALQMPGPVFLPFWTFDIGGAVQWRGWIKDDTAIAGVGLDEMDNAMHFGGIAVGVVTGNYDLAVRSIADMAGKRMQKQDLIYSEGDVPIDLNDVLVPATHSLPAELLGRLQYDTGQATPYDSDVLASWPTEIYSISLSDASLSARERAIASTNKDVEVFTNRPVDPSDSTLTVDRSGMTVLSYKLLLLPVWAGSYTYKGEVYRLVINGQSGQVEGDSPRGSNPVARLFNR